MVMMWVGGDGVDGILGGWVMLEKVELRYYSVD